MKKLAIAFCIISFSMPIFAAPTTIFKGRPITKISEGGTDRTVEQVAKDKAPNLACLISEIDGKYYWASRENVELIPTRGGAFTTYIATNGSGYIRVLEAEMKEAASLMSDAEIKFDYVEHLLIGLKSVTYYGVHSK